jgi:hypothetical protein
MELVYVAAVAGLAALTQSMLGFGAAIVLTPLIAPVVGPQVAVATSLLLGPGMSLGLYAEHRPRAPLRSVVLLSTTAIATTPLGILLLSRANDVALHFLVGGAVLLGAVVTLVSAPRALERPTGGAMSALAGATAGVLRGATSMGGPPVVLYMHWLGGPTERLRSRQIAFFALFTVPGVLFAAIGGVLTPRVWALALVAVVPTVAGLYAGRRLRPRLSERWYRRFSMGLLVVASVVAVGGALAAL